MLTDLNHNEFNCNNNIKHLVYTTIKKYDIYKN